MKMGYGFKLKVWGDYACFTRPEMKVERVSYDVMTPSAARGILEAIYWKPAIMWKIDKIHVMNPIKFDNIRRNEVLGTISVSQIKKAMKGEEVELYQDSNEDRAQRASLLLRDVCYCIEAHFELTKDAGPEDTPEKHYNMALRRMRKGQCYHNPYLGCREFPANFEIIEEGIPASCYSGEKDLGFMLWDLQYNKDSKKEPIPIFYRAFMKDGIIDIEKCLCYGELS